MSSKVASRCLAVATLAFATLLPAASARAQYYGPASMFHALIGEWSHIGTGETGGYNIFVHRNGYVSQQGAPSAWVMDTIDAGGNFAFEGRYPDRHRFSCTYYVTFLAGGNRASFRLVDQRGEGITCAQGLFERAVRRW